VVISNKNHKTGGVDLEVKKFTTEHTVMNEREVERILDTSVRILREIVMLVPVKEILQMLEQNGAHIDWDKQSGRFSESLVERALNGIN
jgi:trimethylamine:corrinoid methyltransferase-like protein